MAITPAVARRLVHTRQVQCQGFLRHDGLWDIEGSMQDIKTDEAPSPGRSSGRVAAGEAFHDMKLRLTVDLALKIHAVEATLDSTPFDGCPSIEDAYQQLVGTRIGPGWSRIVRERLGGVLGCTHLNELLIPMATTAYQTTWFARMAAQEGAGAPLAEGDMLVNTCHTWADNGEAVRRFIPHLFKDS